MGTIQSDPVSTESISLQLCGVREGLLVIAINGQYLYTSSLQSHLLALLTPPGQDPPPLRLTVKREGSEYVALEPTSAGLGFNLKGSLPVIIHRIDKGMFFLACGQP